MAPSSSTTTLDESRKRPSESDPDDQPLSKKFERLYIGQPPPSSNGLHATNGVSSQPETWIPDPMLLDDTKYTTYIHNIDRELEEVDNQERQISFLPEIEKKLNSIPKLVLADPKPKNQEIVLYRAPCSLTVPEDKDYVRNAILEFRANKQVKKGRSHSMELDSIQGKDLRHDRIGDLDASGQDNDIIMKN